MATRPRKGDRLIYTGKYAHEMPEVFGDMTPNTPVAPYPPGIVVGFHTNRFHGPSVTVLFDKEEGQIDNSYADWPIHETAAEDCEGCA